MFYLENYLLQLDGITAVLEHKATRTKGQYSVMTTANTFKLNRTIIKDNLATWANEILDNNGQPPPPPPPPYPSPTLCFKQQQYEDESTRRTSYQHFN